MANHNHSTRDIKPPGECPGCDEYHARTRRQVWSVVYDSDTPQMDGSVKPVRMSEVNSKDLVRQQYDVLRDRSRRAPKKNLRIETRFVTDWLPTDHS